MYKTKVPLELSGFFFGRVTAFKKRAMDPELGIEDLLLSELTTEIDLYSNRSCLF